MLVAKRDLSGEPSGEEVVKEEEFVDLQESLVALKNYTFLGTTLTVYVVSLGGWAWAVAWAQLGVTEVLCVPLTPGAEVQFDEAISIPALAKRLRKVSVPTGFGKKGTVVTFHLTAQQLIDHPEAASQLLACVAISTQSGTNVTVGYLGVSRACQAYVRQGVGTGWRWQTMRHRNLGGLTGARVDVGWHGPNQNGQVVEPQARRNPLRPLGRFLEPSSKLTRWSSKPPHGACWTPFADNARPFPWPWARQEPWVEAPTVFFPGRHPRILRPLTEKEIGQLMDVREDWGKELVGLLWNWDHGHSPPLRILGETIISMAEWLRSLARNTVESLESAPTPPVEDWGRVRAPWLDGASETSHMERMAYFGWVWGTGEAEEVAVATRDDDAGVDLSLWSIGGKNPEAEVARTSLRKFLFSWWIRRTQREAHAWLRTPTAQVDHQKNVNGVRDCIRRLSNSTWWDWSDGSRLLFWRWPLYWRAEARDGMEGLHLGIPEPRLTFPQPPAGEAWVVEKDMEKLEKLLRRRYIVCGPCRNTVPRFPVPKGTTDIRVVWDLRKNGLNEQMYTPSFFLPVMNTYLRRLGSGAYSGDFDIGEQFHNYNLHAREQTFCGVHVPSPLVEKLRAEGLEIDPIMRWDRLVFGWQSSPLLALRMLARALEIVKRSPVDSTSAFAWDRVELNLPGSDHYDPGKTRVSCWDREGLPATQLVIYFDDGRVFGATEARAIAGLRQVTAGLQHLGNQDAARKRREVSQTPGAWAGGIAYTDQGLIRKFVSQKKWDRAKEFLAWVRACCDTEVLIERKRFRSGKGFLLHLAQTYDFMQPHLKGLHLAEEAWRRDRGADGWKRVVDAAEHESFLDDDELEIIEPAELDLGAPRTEELAPEFVDKIQLLRIDVRALGVFFEPPTPVQVIVRPVRGAKYVVYGAGDASGEGFGSTIHPLGMQPLLRHGFWCTELSEQTSNWRELRNLLDAIKVESEAGKLVGTELWVATDNSTAALAYYKGSSSSEKLQDMVVELRQLTITGNFVLNIFHIAGTRMIEIGVDGLSRGEFQLEALAGTPASAAPLHLTALERSPSLRNWIASWVTEDHRIASPNDWFYNAQQGGQHDNREALSETWVWDLPPAAALYALEELGGARLKRHETLRGIVIIPNLLQHEWRRRLTKGTDFHFTIPAGSIPEWPSGMHEALTVGVYLPLFRYRPWDWKRVSFVVPMGIALSKMYANGNADPGALLRQFWSSARSVSELRQSVLCLVLQAATWHRFLSVSPRE